MAKVKIKPAGQMPPEFAYLSAGLSPGTTQANKPKWAPSHYHDGGSKTFTPKNKGPVLLATLTSPTNIKIPGVNPNMAHAAKLRELKAELRKVKEQRMSKAASNNHFGGTDQGPGGRGYA